MTIRQEGNQNELLISAMHYCPVEVKQIWFILFLAKIFI